MGGPLEEGGTGTPDAGGADAGGGPSGADGRRAGGAGLGPVGMSGKGGASSEDGGPGGSPVSSLTVLELLGGVPGGGSDGTGASPEGKEIALAGSSVGGPGGSSGGPRGGPRGGGRGVADILE
jgi:hypothetical protein